MPEKWAGNLVGKMYSNRVTREDLAHHLGVTKAYVSMVLSGSRKPQNAKERFESALDQLIEKRKHDSA